MRMIELRKIRPNRFNPRLVFDTEEMERLTESIKEKGLLQPIIVREISDHYEVVMGERRYRAAQQAGLHVVPVIVREYTDDQVIELSLVENIQRTDLSAVEKGNSCKVLMEKFPERFPNRTKVAEAIGVSEATIGAWLELVQAPKELQVMIAPARKIGIPRERGKIDYDTAVTISRKIEEPERQVAIAKEIARRPIYRRQARQVISKAAREPERPLDEVFREVVEAPYEMPFRLVHMKPIIEGKKVQTSRRGIPDPRVKIGAIVHASVWEPHFASLRITSIERKRLGEFTQEDAEREGGYSLDEFKKAWKRINKELNDNEMVYILSFEAI